MKSLSFCPKLPNFIKRSAAFLMVALMVNLQAQAAFHLWTIRELYSNSSGTLQFIELFDPAGFQNFVGSQQISAINIGASVTHTFTLPGITLPGDTLGHTLLFGTAGLQAAGGPAPDFIIPNGFLFTAGGSISFFGSNSGAYTALPTDGSLSRTWGDGNAVNSPQNFAGQTGVVTVPEPATLGFLTLGALGLLGLRRRSN